MIGAVPWAEVGRMSRNPLETALARMRGIVAEQEARGLGDRELIHAYRTKNDQAAFAVLVKRHASLVFAVCQRVLHQAQDAEDAFQAVFIVLARKAGSLKQCPSLASWLHRVALGIALNARRTT